MGRVAALVLVGLVLAGCGGAPAPTEGGGSAAEGGCGGGASVNAQCSTVVEIENERSTLTQGYLIYPNALTTDVGSEVELQATVYGPAAFSALKRGTAISKRMSSSVPVVQIGGYVQAKLTSAAPGQTTSESTADQPIVGPNDTATWKWLIQPSQPGTFDLTLTFNVLRGDSTQALTADESFDTTLTVGQTATQKLGNGATTSSDVLKTIGGIVGGLVAIFTPILAIAKHFNKWPFKPAPVPQPAQAPVRTRKKKRKR